MKILRGFLGFWYDFIIGDDWKLAAAVALVGCVGAVLVIVGFTGAVLPVLLAIGMAAAFTIALVVDVRGQER